MGSSLRDQYPVDPENVWSPFKYFLSAYDRITLHPSDTRYELIEPARVTSDQAFGIIYSEFIEELRRMKGTPEAVLTHPELLQLFLPVLRAEFFDLSDNFNLKVGFQTHIYRS